MTKEEARSIVLEAARVANASGISDPPQSAKFLTGETDFGIDDLELDSLGVMEMCIALELETGIPLDPEDLRSIDTLQQLANLICET